MFVPGVRSVRSREEVPGPGAYENRYLATGSEGCRITLKSRHRNPDEPDEKARKEDLPGPGTYLSLGIHSEGKYILSTLKNSGAACWSPSKGNRFKTNKYQIENPPPGSYDVSDRKDGNYILSKYRSAGVRLLKPNHKKPGDIDVRIQSCTPGPGAYDPPSSFRDCRTPCVATKTPNRGTASALTGDQTSGRRGSTHQEGGFSDFVDSQRRRSVQMNRPKVDYSSPYYRRPGAEIKL